MASTTILTLISAALIIGSPVQSMNFALESNDVTDYYLSTRINFVFDLFLKHYTRKVVEEGKTQIPMDDLDWGFSTKILNLDIEGAVIVKDGLCGNVSTLQRTGDAVMDRVGKELVLTSHMGLSHLQVDYGNYDLTLLGVHQKGKIHVTIGENSLWLKLNVRLEPSCLITLSELKIEKLDNIQVDITNLGVFENLTDEIVSWVTREVTIHYRTYVEKAMFPDLSKAVQNADLCHFLPI